MNDIVIAKLKRDLKKIDKMVDHISLCHEKNTIESVKAWWSIKLMAKEYKGLDCAAIQDITTFPDSSVRAIFFIELIRNNPRSLCRNYLESCLGHENFLVREDACYALAQYEGAEVKKLLENKLKITDDQYLRDALVLSLSKFDHDEVPKHVLEYFEIPEKRGIAVTALSNNYSIVANDMLLDAWIDNDKRVSSEAYKELQSEKRGTKHVTRRLIDIVGSKKGKYQVEAIQLLGKHKNEGSILFLEGIYHKVSQKARQQILLTLGKIGTKKATITLIKLMEEEEVPEIIAYGCIGLGTCEYSQAVDHLMRVIREKKYGAGEIKPVGMGFGGGLYEIAAIAIKRNKVPSSIPYMTELLSYENARIRIEMAKGLATRKSIEALGALDKAINNETDNETKSALEISYKKLLKLKH